MLSSGVKNSKVDGTWKFRSAWAYRRREKEIIRSNCVSVQILYIFLKLTRSTLLTDEMVSNRLCFALDLALTHTPTSLCFAEKKLKVNRLSCHSSLSLLLAVDTQFHKVQKRAWSCHEWMTESKSDRCETYEYWISIERACRRVCESGKIIFDCNHRHGSKDMCVRIIYSTSGRRRQSMEKRKLHNLALKQEEKFLIYFMPKSTHDWHSERSFVVCFCITMLKFSLKHETWDPLTPRWCKQKIKRKESDNLQPRRMRMDLFFFSANVDIPKFPIFTRSSSLLVSF